jgi:chemotaxis protein methyltransferase CheR
LAYGDYLRFRELILNRSGLYFPEKKKSDLAIGLFKALEDAPQTASGIDSYYNFLKEAATPEAQKEMDRLINLLTIGETHFFRDSAQFDALSNHVLPELIARKRTAAGSIDPVFSPHLRLWSAGCSTGEEPYSLAILLRELIPDIERWQVLILATDINRDSLKRAQGGLYTNWSFREARAKTMRSLYFSREGKRYRLRDKIRRMVTFAHLNLIEDDYPSIRNNTVSMDLIICRNVTIYFAEPTTRQVIQRFYNALVPGGWLVVGHAEPSLTIYRAFQARNYPNTLLYQKTGQPTSWPEDWKKLETTPSLKVSHPSLISKTSPAAPKPILTERMPPAIQPKKSKLSSLSQTKTLTSIPETKKYQKASDSDPCKVAETLLNEGRSVQVIDTLESNLEELPTDVQAFARCLLARAYANQGQWDKARYWGESALKLDNLLSEAYYILAMVDEHEGEIEQAIDKLKKVIYLDRQKPLPYFNLAMLHKKQRQVPQAQRALNNVIRILSQWAPEKVIPDSGGSTARRLLITAKRIKVELENL